MSAGLSKEIKFGVCIRRLWPTHLALRYARLADKLGYHQIWMNCSALSRDPFLTLALIAKETSQINLGVATVDPFTRHPAVIAGSAATLAEASGRKVDIAIASSHPEILSSLGLNTEKPVERVRKAVMTAKKFLAGESLEYRGEVFHLDSVAKGEVRTLVGAVGPRMAGMAGEVADGIVSVQVSPEYERDFVGWFFYGLKNSARDRSEVKMIMNVNVAVTSDKKILKMFRPIAAEQVPHITTTNEEISQRYLGINRQESLNIQAHPDLLTEELMKKVTTSGSTEECVERIRYFRNLGFDQIYSTYPVNPGEGSAEKQIEVREHLIRSVAEHLF